MAQGSFIWDGNSGQGGLGDCGPYSAANWAQVLKALMSGKTGVSEVGQLEVMETSPASKSVRIVTGRAVVRGKVYWLDADTTLTISDNTSGNPRIDRVVLEADWATQTIRLKVLEGTPAATPTAPSLTQVDGTLWQLPLAQIAVTNGFTSITSGNITDEREFVNPPLGYAVATVGGKTADYSTNSTSFVTIDSTEFKLTVTTHGGDVLVWFTGILGWATAIRNIIFDVEIDGIRIGTSDGLWGHGVGNLQGAGFVWRVTGLSAGSHTFELVWRVDDSAMTGYLRVGGTAGLDYKAQFGAMEVAT